MHYLAFNHAYEHNFQFMLRFFKVQLGKTALKMITFHTKEICY